MSKNFVSKDTIDALVTAALHWGYTKPGEFWFRPVATTDVRRIGWNQATQVGEMLWRQNWETTEGWVEPLEVKWPGYEFDRYPGEPDPVVILKTISFYEYQTETDPDIWDVSEAAGFTRYLRLVAEKQLPGWEDAPWGIDDRAAFTAS
ncbi:hypothetical protein [Blastococcus litoris]|uniref:hypothetical protein n=1 Tax=Blastococcus litoris TaxID=2171622 RepID=UPI000E3025E2|nr:hypothetical protein [Blastococcus litoris]